MVRLLLEVRNLSYFIERKRILEDINFKLFPGEVLGIVGPNGAGKTTLLKLISGILQPSEGKVLVEGKSIKKFNRREISKKIAMVPQNTYTSFPFTAFDVVLMGRHPHVGRFKRETEKDLNKVKECMLLAGIWHLRDKKITEISGGELQKVFIAQAISQETPILLLDEPTSHLDINSQLEIMEIVAELNKKKRKSVVLVSHDLNLAARYSGRMILLKEGKVFAQGKVEEVLTSENIKRVYHLNALVRKHPVTGSIYTLPVSFRVNSKDKGEVRRKRKVHLIGGGGSASRMIKELCDGGYDVSLGVVNVFDADFETAKLFEVPCVVEAPFSPITSESYEKNIRFIRESELVILCNVPFGEGNLLNLEAALEALGMGVEVLVQNKVPVEKRDYTGGKAKKIFEKLLDKGAHLVEDEREVTRFVEEFFKSRMRQEVRR